MALSKRAANATTIPSNSKMTFNQSEVAFQEMAVGID